jgi:hypothetical protein
MVMHHRPHAAERQWHPAASCSAPAQQPCAGDTAYIMRYLPPTSRSQVVSHEKKEGARMWLQICEHHVLHLHAIPLSDVYCHSTLVLPRKFFLIRLCPPEPPSFAAGCIECRVAGRPAHREKDLCPWSQERLNTPRCGALVNIADHSSQNTSVLSRQSREPTNERLSNAQPRMSKAKQPELGLM